MKIVFMGTPDFAVPVLESLIEAGHEVTGVFCQPDKPKGRGGKVLFPPVKECAVAHGIPVFQPVKVRTPENLEILKNLEPDVIAVAAFGQILPKQILELPRYGCLNVHASLLPDYRGAAPIQWAILNGETETGVSIMKMNEGLDTGDVMSVTKVAIEPDETGGSLFEKLSRLGGPALLEVLRQLEAGTAVCTPQSGESSYAPMLKKEMGLIDWKKSAKELDCLIRGMNPWPSAYTALDGKVLKIWKARVLEAFPAEILDRAGMAEGFVPGMVIADHGRLFAAAGEGALEILELQLEGKKRMNTDAFLRGYTVETGSRLGE